MTVEKGRLGRRVAQLSHVRMSEVCRALGFALGCDSPLTSDRSVPCWHEQPLPGTMGPMLDPRAEAAVRELVERYRAQCLWFLRPDYYPHTPEDVSRVLGLIEQYRDLEALRRVTDVRRWLSPHSNAPSAGSSSGVSLLPAGGAR